ncbi:MAG: hypothetical protein JST48_14600 [Bacteroidetes bacterium]|nr:hypothetical protein [Bacteroidota bacterium]
MKYYFILFVFLSSSVFAQTAITTKANDTYTKLDTINALQHLFKRERLNAKIGIVTMSGVFLGFGGKFLSSSSQDFDAVLAGLGLVAVVTNSIKLKTYSKKNLTKIIEEYNKGEKIPRKVKKRLRERDFHKVRGTSN